MKITLNGGMLQTADRIGKSFNPRFVCGLAVNNKLFSLFSTKCVLLVCKSEYETLFVFLYVFLFKLNTFANTSFDKSQDHSINHPK